MHDDIFIIDGVTHAFNMSEENFANRRYAEPVNEFLANLLGTAPAGYALEPDSTKRDWQVDETASVLFKESRTDIGIFHHTPIYFYKDGLSGIDKSAEAVEKYPNRFIGSYVAVDPLLPEPKKQLDEGIARVGGKVMGLKLYPVSYKDGEVVPWRMDDRELTFPLFEYAKEKGISNVAVHKSLPLGPAPSTEAFRPGDVEGAAAAFPELTFEIVHGGISFTEETAWVFGRYPNIWINLETVAIYAVLRPRVFAEIMAGLITVGTEAAIDQMIWASGATNYHPQCQLEAFLDFQMPEDLLQKGNFWPIPQFTTEHKRKILGENAARLYGLDIDELKANIADDEFSESQSRGLAAPYSTTELADKVIANPVPAGP